MSTVVLAEIPFAVDLDLLLEKLHLKNRDGYPDEIKIMAAEASSLAKPKIAYKELTIEEKGADFVVIDKIKITSRLLRENMEEAESAYPYVITCGTELEEWSKRYKDYFDSFCADTIKEMALRAAMQMFEDELEKEFCLGHAVSMNPGSLAEWPITEQIQVFNLLGNVEELIGVKLTDSYLMVPIKSVSGIRFQKEGTFENCQLCPRAKCLSRKAPYSGSSVLSAH